jgi:hypothetical protein
MKFVPLIFVALLSLLNMLPANAIVPGGLVASYNYGSSTASSAEVTITVEKAPPNTLPIFWAQQFYTKATIDHGGYFGLQTQGSLNGQNIGKMVIFSIWNADAAEAGPGATAQTFGGEGIGYSVRKPFDWSEGTAYRFKLEKDGTLWWRLTITDDLGGSTYLGRIRITQDVLLDVGYVAFTEIYGDVASCDAIPPFRTIFSNFRLGTTLLPAYGAAPYGNCVSSARGRIVGNSAAHEVKMTDVCSLDIDGDGKILATTDGLLSVRLALGITGASLLNGVTLPATAARRDWAAIRNHLVERCGMTLP